MGWNFRKSIKLFPGVRLNLSKQGFSFSFGPRGFKTTLNSKGSCTHSFSLPGTGFRYTRRRQMTRCQAKNNRNNVSNCLNQTEMSNMLQSVLSDSFKEWGILIRIGFQDPFLIAIRFDIDFTPLSRLGIQASQRTDVFCNYICLCSCLIARKLFEISPAEEAIISISYMNHYLLSVDYLRDKLMKMNTTSHALLDIVRSFQHRLNYQDDTGFDDIVPLDANQSIRWL